MHQVGGQPVNTLEERQVLICYFLDGQWRDTPRLQNDPGNRRAADSSLSCSSNMHETAANDLTTNYSVYLIIHSDSFYYYLIVLGVCQWQLILMWLRDSVIFAHKDY